MFLYGVFVHSFKSVVDFIMSSDVLLQCPHCGTDRENFEKYYIEVYEHTMCSACDNLVASSTIHDVVLLKDNEHDANYPTSYSCNHCDQDGSDDQSENIVDISDVGCEIDLIDNGRARCNELLPLSLNNKPGLKNSYSAFNFEEKKNTSVATRSVATLDNGELSRDSLKKARELHFQSLSCTNCTSPGSQLVPVEGIKDIFHCLSCFSVHGVDDSMNYYDLLQKGDYMVEACGDCGNIDPNLFLLEYGSNPDSVSLKCVMCSDMAEQSESKGTGDTGQENKLDPCVKDLIQYECKCNNSSSELQEIVIHSSSNTVFVKCWICEREDMIALPGSISSAVDIPAAGDGMSTGRTRITSLSDIQIGDHIAWHQHLGYWHHAIVTEVSGGQIRVMHYNGPSLPNKGM